MADAARGQHGTAHRVFRAQVGHRAAFAHGRGHTRAHQIHPAARPQVPAGDQFVDGVGRQDHDIKGFTGLHPFGGVHATHRFDRHRHAAGGLEGDHQLGQHLARRHGRDALEAGVDGGGGRGVRHGLG
ncbi:hypothetical protein D9M69_576620 [compost metagenome]